MAARNGGQERLLRGIAVTVLAVWVLATLVQLVDPARQVPGTVNAITGLVVSALFGASVIRRNGKDDDA